jgi:hypothetical protein
VSITTGTLEVAALATALAASRLLLAAASSEAYGRLESMKRLGARALPAATVVAQAWRDVRGTDRLCRARRSWPDGLCLRR